MAPEGSGGKGFAGRGLVALAVDRMRKAPLLVVSFAGSVGIVLVDRGWLAGWLGMAAILGVVAAWAMWRRVPVAGIFCLAGLCWIGMGMRHQARIDGIRSFPLAAELRNGDPVAVSGTGWIAGVVESGERSVKTVLMIEALEIGGRRVPCEHRVPCWIQKPLHGIGYGQLVGFTGRLLPLEGATVPGGFDAAAFYFRKEGALAKLEIRDGDRAELLPGERGSALVRWAWSLRDRFEQVVLLGVPPDGEPYGRLVAAMALGAHEQSPEDLEEWFRTSGTIHLFAVSGLHVSIVVGILAGLAALAGLSKSRSVMLIVPLVLFYAVLTGLSPSAVRAAVMASVFLFGYGLREKPRLLNSLGFAALAILGHDSQQLFLPGFQLSFMVMLAIALMVPGLSARIARPLTSDPFLPKRLVRRPRRMLDRCSVHFAATLAMSLAAWGGSAGALAWHFESVSMVSIVANVVMVPISSAIIGLAALSIAASCLHLGWLVVIVNRLNVWVACVLTMLAQWFSSIPGATLNTGGWREPVEGEKAEMRIDVLGSRGDGAALLELRAGRGTPPIRWLVDTGSPQTYRGQLLPLLRNRGINRIDAVVLTHGDVGHIGGAVSAIHQFRPELIVESTVKNRAPAYREIREFVERRSIRSLSVDRGARLRVGDAVVRVLHPAGDAPGRLADDRALVLKIEYAGYSVLLTSDSGFDTEQELLGQGADLRADIWIRGQHSESPSGQSAFVAAVSPAAVLSTHEEFPESERIPETLRAALRNAGVRLYEVGPSGMVSVEINASGLRVRPFADPEGTLYLSPRR